MTAPAVVIDGLTKVFGGRQAVAGLSLSVAPGEIYGLLGPNGAGKTTTLRMLVGLLTPTSGRAVVAGVDVGQDPQRAKARVGFLSASTGLHGRLTAGEVLAYFGRLHGMPPSLVRSRQAEVCEALALGAFIDRRCETLSTGEKQRVSLARAVFHDPPVLVLDEPTSGLDVLASHFLRAFVRRERERGKAIIFSTHYLAEAELLCDRIGLVHEGRVLREGTPSALRAEAGTATLEEAFLKLVGVSEGSGAGSPAANQDEDAP